MKKSTLIIIFVLLSLVALFGTDGNSPEKNTSNDKVTNLEATVYCDFNHPVFKDIPIKKSKSDTKTALDIFYYTRDIVILLDMIK